MGMDSRSATPKQPPKGSTETESEAETDHVSMEDTRQAQDTKKTSVTDKESNDMNPDPRQVDSTEISSEDLNTTDNPSGQHHDAELPVPTPEGVLEEELTLVAELEQQLQESRDKHLRLLAEFDNFKRRNAKERLELRKTAAEDIIVDLLGVLDDFNRAKTAMESKPEALKESEGFLLIAGKLRHILDQRELKAMSSLGTEFDPERHEAITEIPAPTDDLKGKVVDVVEEGYILGEKIIRYAKVVVGK